MPPPLDLDVNVPVLVFKIGRYVIHHGTVGIIRSLGRLGVPVYAIVEDRFTPAAMSSYLTDTFVWDTRGLDPERLLAGMATIGERLGRPTILVPTDDSAAAFVAEHAEALGKWFLFPQVPRTLPRQLANKKDLYFLCNSIGVSCPKAEFPNSIEDVYAFLESSTLPVVVKAAAWQRLPRGARSVSIARTPQELITIYQRAESQESPNLVLQEYIPPFCAEDWIFNGYCNPHTNCFVAFTGKKLHSYPPFAGPTALGVSVLNESLQRHNKLLMNAIAYSGIVDIDYVFDRRDGQYKLLDCNPRIGSSFRMFVDHYDVDVVRALHLDLTGRRVQPSPELGGRTFIVEPYEMVAGLNYMRRGGLTVRAWWQSLQGSRELAWLHRDDLKPFFSMCLRLMFHVVARTLRKIKACLSID